MHVYEIVQKLIGEIDPVGETHTDNTRFENLKAMIDLTDSLLTDIGWVSTKEGTPEFSISRAGEFARKFLRRMGIET